MMTTLRIPRILQQYCAGQSEVRLTGSTVRALLEELRHEYPQLYQCICTETGALRRHVNLFVNNDFLRDRQGLDTHLEADDVVSVFQAVSGG